MKNNNILKWILWIIIFFMFGYIFYNNFIEGYTDEKTIKIYNSHHLGDNIFSMIYFYNIKPYIEDNNIKIEYYMKPEYHKQVQEFVPSQNIVLKEYVDNMDTNGMHDIWIGNKEYKCNFYDYSDKKDVCGLNANADNGFNDFLKSFFNEFNNKININAKKMNEFIYTDEDLIKRYENLSDDYKNIDILVINSDPASGQYKLDDAIWNKKIEEFVSKKWKVVITKKSTNVAKCTVDDKLTVKDIAAISTHAKVIIAINTGVITGFFNSYTMNNVKRVYIFDDTLNYSYKNWINKNHIDDIPINELSQLLS